MFPGHLEHQFSAFSPGYRSLVTSARFRQGKGQRGRALVVLPLRKPRQGPDAMNKIMMATDFSERSDRALRRATLLARQFGASIELVHVIDDDQPSRVVDSERTEAESLLYEMAATLRDVDGVACETRLMLASPFAGIVRAVQDTSPDLLVIGPHRRQVLRDVFVGTTAERTIRSVACPVLMVNAPPSRHYRHILETTDLSDGSHNGLKRFSELGIGEEARKSLLYVFDAPLLRLTFSDSAPRDEQEHYLTDEKKDASQNLSRFLESAKLGHVEPMVRHEESSAAHEILKAAAEAHADLIVVSAHSRSGLTKLLIGSVTEQVLKISPVDVLAIPQTRRGL